MENQTNRTGIVVRINNNIRIRAVNMQFFTIGTVAHGHFHMTAEPVIGQIDGITDIHTVLHDPLTGQGRRFVEQAVQIRKRIDTDIQQCPAGCSGICQSGRIMHE